jgi:hypothetical protein
MWKDTEFEELFLGWYEKERKNYVRATDKNGHVKQVYLKKGYIHLDNRIWLPDSIDFVKKLFKNKLIHFNKKTNRVEWHSFKPFIKFLIKTPRYKFQKDDGVYDLETKIRPICIASHLDSLIFSFYSYVLSNKYEDFLYKNKIEEFPIAYRTSSEFKGKCNIQFSKEVFDYIKEKGECVVLSLDIKGYFDNINHDILKKSIINIIGEKLPDDLYRIFKVLTQYSYINKSSILKKYNNSSKRSKLNISSFLELIPGLTDSEKFIQLKKDKLITLNSNKGLIKKSGIPQGSGLSAVLSNIYLSDFDLYVSLLCKGNAIFYRRYCDDLIVVCDELQYKSIQESLIQKIKDDFYLTIQSEKVEITEFKINSKGIIRSFNKSKIIVDDEMGSLKKEHYYYKSLQYLGFEFNGKDIFVRSSSLSRYFRKLKGRINKTISMAYGRHGSGNIVWKQQLFHRYTHLGKRNFLKYVYDASKNIYTNSLGDEKNGFDSKAIQKQLRRHFDILIDNFLRENKYYYNKKGDSLKGIKN